MPIKTFKNSGLFDRIASAFAPKNNESVVDKMLPINTLLWLILALGAVRVIDAALKVNEGMHPVLLWGVAIFTLALTEGGFVMWKNFRYSATTNKAQKDIALGAMVMAFIASVAVGISDYVGLSMGNATLVIGSNILTGREVMVWVFGVAYVIAIVSHVACALAVREVDDDIKAKNDENQIQLAAKLANQETRASEQRTLSLLQSSEREVAMHARMMAQVTLAPFLATTEAMASVKRQIIDAYGDSIDQGQLNIALASVMPSAQDMTARIAADVVRHHLKENRAEDLGIDPEKVAASVREAGEKVAGQSKSLYRTTPRHTAPPPLNIPASDFEDDELTPAFSPNGHRPKQEGQGPDFL